MGKRHVDVGDEDSVHWVMAFPAGTSPVEAAEILDEEGYALAGYECGHDHDCCGCWFFGAIYIRQYGFGTIAEQSAGRNV